jgi:hypothetical protein
VTSIVDQVIELHQAFDASDLPHAFGGALALAWCTQRARGTIDIDLNVFVDTSHSAEVLRSLPEGLQHSDRDLAVLKSGGQVRLQWDGTPIDLFLSTTDFHREVATRARVESFGGLMVPFLSCSDLAVFKVYFNRSRDWVDVEEMLAIGTLDVPRTLAVITTYLGHDDERVGRLANLARQAGEPTIGGIDSGV